MIQQILAQTVVIAAVAYALFSIVKAIYPYTKKNAVSCKTSNCNCSLSNKKITGTRLSATSVESGILNSSRKS